jgi:hypothetical protein
MTLHLTTKQWKLLVTAGCVFCGVGTLFEAIPVAVLAVASIVTNMVWIWET